MSKSKPGVSKEMSELYDKLLVNFDLERKGKTTPYTSLNGHMTSFLSKEETMGLRLSEADRSAFIEEYNGKLMEQHGRTMKEFVEVPRVVLADTNAIAVYFGKSIDYTETLKPK